MSSNEEEKKEEEENLQEELEQSEEEQETIHSSEDLEKQKLIKSEQNIEGNIGHIQIFIQNLETLMGTSNNGYKQSGEQVHSNQPSKSYNLGDLGECIEFVEKYGNSEYLIIAIILCTFGVVNLRDLSELRQKLAEQLWNARLNGGKTGVDGSFGEGYLSVNTILNAIGGKYFIREDGQKCIGLSGGEKTLDYLLEQFPMLKNPIISWLLQINETCKYRTRFDVQQISVAFVRIISIDFADAQRNIFPQLYVSPNNAGLLGTLALQLYEKETVEKDIKKMVSSWLHTSQNWLWRPACLFICGLAEKNSNISFEQELKRNISRRVMLFKRSDHQFTAILLRQSKYFRILFTDVLSSVFAKEAIREKRLKVAELYLALIQRGYYLVNKSFVELPLVACDTMQQQEYLSDIIGQVMDKFPLRKRLYMILKAYLKEVSAYGLSSKVIDHLCAYFYIMGSSDMDYRNEILGFLKEIKNKIADDIYCKLSHTYEKKGELLPYERVSE